MDSARLEAPKHHGGRDVRKERVLAAPVPRLVVRAQTGVMTRTDSPFVGPAAPYLAGGDDLDEAPPGACLRGLAAAPLPARGRPDPRGAPDRIDAAAGAPPRRQLPPPAVRAGPSAGGAVRAREGDRP